MNIEQFYRDYNIKYVTENHKHARDGWVNIECPFCHGNAGYHLGYDTNGHKFVCWRCGGKYPIKVVEKLLNITYAEASVIWKQYGMLFGSTKRVEKNILLKKFKLPPGAEELSQAHRNYLESRNFDPDEIIKTWGILGTGLFSKLDKIDYSRRLIIPYFWDNEIVSFDSRDISDRAQNKYMACKEIRETINHKHILYGIQSRWKDTGIIVEGTTDCWRFGVNSCATSGIKFTPKQVRVIAKSFNRVAVCFDGESQANEQASKLIKELRFRKVDAFRVNIEGDPGGMEQSEANYLVKQLLSK